MIAHPDAPAYKPSTSRGNYIEDPVFRLAQVFLGYNLLGQANTSASITQVELYFMWCMKEQRNVHLGFWIAAACHTIATHSACHLNIFHFLGAFVRNNLTIEFVEGCKPPRMCPLPEWFDLDFFIRTKILTARRGKLYFYEVGRTDRPEGQLEKRLRELSGQQPRASSRRSSLR